MNPKCRTCGRPIYGVPLDATKHRLGWLHDHNNAERCPAPHRSLASPVTLEDMNAKALADGRRARLRAGVKPRT